LFLSNLEGLMTHIHIIGIGGTGLSAIARVLLERGETVSGSDVQVSPLAHALQKSGAEVYTGHHPDQVAGADLVVRSSAIPEDNVEVQAARKAGIPVMKRVDFLPHLMQSQKVIAVAGTHGKTTTTAMIAWVLTALDQDPSYIIGSTAVNLGNNAHAGQGPAFVIEADEYDGMFLGLDPYLAVVTNIEHDHPDCFPTPEDFYQAFHDFVERIMPGGILLAYRGDPGVMSLLQEGTMENVRIYVYGSEEVEAVSPDFIAENLQTNPFGGYSFDVTRKTARLGDTTKLIRVNLRVPGEHNVSNALAALAVAELLGLPMEEAAQALGGFRGTDRRFQLVGEVNGLTIVDDYAHHPTEIKATLAAAKVRYPKRDIWAVWQPHTYTRTRTLFDEFVMAFGDADHVLVTEIYPARESPPSDGLSASELVEAMSHPDKYFAVDFDQALHILLTKLQPSDVLLVLSAGDADQLSRMVLASFRSGKQPVGVANLQESLGSVGKERPV
jgi:UDP-N-acetylmuramate--alanine ligase